MFSLSDLRIPVLSSPMAGGPSAPALVHAVATAGGSGFLAAGYKTVDAVAEEIAEVRRLGDVPFGVNLFVPAKDVSRTQGHVAAVEAHRERLARLCERFGCEVATPDARDRDGWDEKIELLLSDPVPIVSFMFGCPDADVIARFHDAGTFVTVTVTDPAEAQVATARGADALVVQGPEAGGHRGTHAVDKRPDERSLVDLLRSVVPVSARPLIAAGGISRPDHVVAALGAGATAVQIGTALIRTPESGAHPLHKSSLRSGAFERTRVTRTFSGRLARALENDLVRELHDDVPAAYPEVNQMMRGLRAAAQAAGDPQYMAMYAGVGFRDATESPAAEVVASLWHGAAALRKDA